MTLTECPVCGENNFKEVLSVKDHLLSGESFSIVHCDNCSTRFTNPRPNDDELGKYYQSDEYISHTNEGNSLVNRIYKIARYFTLRNKRNLISAGTEKYKLLDLGCGTGHFIHHCSDHGWNVLGVEPDSFARETAKQHPGVRVYKDLNEVDEIGFSRITLWHVLEHLPDIEGTISQLKDLLASDGKIFIAVPNYLSFEASKFKENWAAYDVPRHLYHFTPKSIHILAEKNGLVVEQTYPMMLDSFYISLLSNKNKYGKSKLIGSFVTGLLSNIYARKSGNYSSLIYQIGKKGD